MHRYTDELAFHVKGGHARCQSQRAGINTIAVTAVGREFIMYVLCRHDVHRAGQRQLYDRVAVCGALYIRVPPMYEARSLRSVPSWYGMQRGQKPTLTFSLCHEQLAFGALRIYTLDFTVEGNAV